MSDIKQPIDQFCSLRALPTGEEFIQEFSGTLKSVTVDEAETLTPEEFRNLMYQFCDSDDYDPNDWDSDCESFSDSSGYTHPHD